MLSSRFSVMISFRGLQVSISSPAPETYMRIPTLQRPSLEHQTLEIIRTWNAGTVALSSSTPTVHHMSLANDRKPLPFANLPSCAVTIYIFKFLCCCHVIAQEMYLYQLC